MTGRGKGAFSEGFMEGVGRCKSAAVLEQRIEALESDYRATRSAQEQTLMVQQRIVVTLEKVSDTVNEIKSDVKEVKKDTDAKFREHEKRLTNIEIASKGILTRLTIYVTIGASLLAWLATNFSKFLMIKIP